MEVLTIRNGGSHAAYAKDQRNSINKCNQFGEKAAGWDGDELAVTTALMNSQGTKKLGAITDSLETETQLIQKPSCYTLAQWFSIAKMAIPRHDNRGSPCNSDFYTAYEEPNVYNKRGWYT